MVTYHGQMFHLLTELGRHVLFVSGQGSGLSHFEDSTRLLIRNHSEVLPWCCHVWPRKVHGATGAIGKRGLSSQKNLGRGNGPSEIFREHNLKVAEITTTWLNVPTSATSITQWVASTWRKLVSTRRPDIKSPNMMCHSLHQIRF